jgi:hypothetical protein
MASKFFTLASLAAVAYGHIKMVQPAPFDNAALLNGPLEPDGSNFPCKNPNYGNIGTMNTYAIGSKAQLQLIGSAVHGGGSCQISVTYDNPPTKNSVWKVIHSIEGGCPARNQDANYPEDSAEFPTPDTYDFTMPAIPEGEAIIAWTWFNKVGNREMYMNCGPATITGTGSADTYNALPDMMVANIGGSCSTSEGVDIQFPNPGSSLEKNDKGAYGPPNGDCGSKGTSPPPPPPPATNPDPTPAPEPTPAPTPSTPGGVFLPNPGQSSAPAVGKPTPAPTTPGNGSGPSGALSGACTTNGQWNCIDGSAFQQCASGMWSAATQLAAGTKCTPGQSTNFLVEAA